MFSFIKSALGSIYTNVTAKLSGLFGRSKVDENTLEELRAILLAADAGVGTTNRIITQLRERLNKGTLSTGAALQEAVKTALADMLLPAVDTDASQIILLVGINGSGKTTSAAKLAARALAQGKKPLLVAADTFRAAAVAQLKTWAEKLGVAIITPEEGHSDPARVVYRGCEAFAAGGYNQLIIDTAGRLQTKTNLMQELEKIGRIIHTKLPSARTTTLVTIDAMLGQNSFDQARLFNESTALDGIILTKYDGTGKGGIVFAIADQLRIPVAFISFGETVESLQPFNGPAYTADLVGTLS
jgi:fused signal recognition particle receptor